MNDRTKPLIFPQDLIIPPGLFVSQNFKSNVNTVKTDILDYSERSLTNLLLEGNHTFNDNKLVYNWKIAPTLSKIRDKDVREIPYEVIINGTDTGYIIDPSNAGSPTRTWRYLDELIRKGLLK